jgi:hypothetical protein
MKGCRTPEPRDSNCRDWARNRAGELPVAIQLIASLDATTPPSHRPGELPPTTGRPLPLEARLAARARGDLPSATFRPTGRLFQTAFHDCGFGRESHLSRHE